MSFSFATWNINSIRARSHLVLDWLQRRPECQVLALQEIKCEEGQFPKIFEEKGFHTAAVGQKSYNGVAFISRQPLEITARRLPGATDETARYLEARVQDGSSGFVLGNLYLPNGNSGGEEGYKIKLAFLEALYQRVLYYQEKYEDFALTGDFNVCLTDLDFAPGTLGPEDALIRLPSRRGFRKLLWNGMTDAVRALDPHKKIYTFWDYQNGAFARNQGLRIDHALLSPRLAERLTGYSVDTHERGLEKPSDHAPLIVTLGPARTLSPP